MLRLTDLEVAALSEICGRHPELKAQIEAASVTERENTGAGFYTTLVVDRSAAEPLHTDRVLGNVCLDIVGFEDPMTFLVFMEDGYVGCLEGATVRDTTDQLDICSLESKGPSSNVVYVRF